MTMAEAILNCLMTLTVSKEWLLRAALECDVFELYKKMNVILILLLNISQSGSFSDQNNLFSYLNRDVLFTCRDFCRLPQY